MPPLAAGRSLGKGTPMDPEFWRERWQAGQIGFHRSTANPLLARHWDALGLEPGAPVLVPLSGKSLDLWWLRERGHPVLGVELSEIAVQAFFAEAGLQPVRAKAGEFEVWEAEGVRVLQGNVFHLRPEHLASIGGVYDRAALIALPPDLRAAYVRALERLLPAEARILLVAFETEPGGPGGPPFAVTEADVRALYEPAFRVDVLERGDPAEPGPNIRARGVESCVDVVYALRRR